jgi:bacterioferritin-associated ferredoxin
VAQGVHYLSAPREHLGVASECGKCARRAHGILKECRNRPDRADGVARAA